MPKKATKLDPDRITAHDIFDGIFAMLVMRGWDRLHPYKSHYYEACAEVYKVVRKYCDENDLNCRFVIVLDLHGQSDTAHQMISSWLPSGFVHVRMPGDGSYHFGLNPDWAEDMLLRDMEYTGLSREFYTELTDLFAKVYREGVPKDAKQD